MSSVRIGYAKPEIRVTGFAAARLCGSSIIVGVVMRGADRLEGVLRGDAAGLDLTDAIVCMVSGSPHRGQTRVLIIDAAALKPCTVDAEVIWRRLDKPVIEVGAPLQDSGDARSPHVKSHGLSEWGSRRVLKAATREGTVEAIRVARMVAESLSRA